ncbi:UBE2Z [Symbiodinium sp. KB8]|nr:UBE2Z [Symbiodinium sp. KB8]
MSRSLGWTGSQLDLDENDVAEVLTELYGEELELDAVPWTFQLASRGETRCTSTSDLHYALRAHHMCHFLPQATMRTLATTNVSSRGCVDRELLRDLMEELNGGYTVLAAQVNAVLDEAEALAACGSGSGRASLVRAISAWYLNVLRTESPWATTFRACYGRWVPEKGYHWEVFARFRVSLTEAEEAFHEDVWQAVWGLIQSAILLLALVFPIMFFAWLVVLGAEHGDDRCPKDLDGLMTWFGMLGLALIVVGFVDGRLAQEDVVKARNDAKIWCEVAVRRDISAPKASRRLGLFCDGFTCQHCQVNEGFGELLKPQEDIEPGQAASNVHILWPTHVEVVPLTEDIGFRPISVAFGLSLCDCMAGQVVGYPLHFIKLNEQYGPSDFADQHAHTNQASITANSHCDISKFLRRLLREQADLNRDGLETQGIFHHFDDVHPHKAVAIIIGPDGSPYARAPYLFRFVFPNTYPLKPPSATFCTGDGRVRFNPNLYTNGKVCLSILGTWAGPSWTSLSTFRSVLLSIQSLLSLNPLQNEPGHEHETGRDCDLYSAMLRYESLAVAALQLTKPLASCFEPMRELLGAIFLCNFHAYKHSLGEFAACEGCLDRCPVYGFISKYNPSWVRQQLEELQAELLLRPEAVAVAEELRKQALPSCSEEVACARSSDETGQSAGSDEGVPEGARTHVARGVWRMAGPSVYQFLRRLCLVMVLILAALGFGIAVAFLLGAVASRAHGQAASQQNFRDQIGPGLPRNHELYRQLNQKHAGALNDAFFHYQKRLFEAEGDFDRAMSPDFETSTPPPDANSSWPDMTC